jgi:hypothetical protein
VAVYDIRVRSGSTRGIATLDDPARVEPQSHIWVGSQIAWFKIGDDLPRFAGEGPD